MCELCPKAPDGWIPVYDGGDGMAQDQDGNFIPKNFGRRRPAGLAQQERGRGSCQCIVENQRFFFWVFSQNPIVKFHSDFTLLLKFRARRSPSSDLAR
ncbi:hypothetical protein N7449_001225 [Penicillium cf. viridicatum]|uniref:Uncharacterized protein n=1 Tax=Penicillium cf. viridicatum TaxID=2972119 RepID=A0A9W9T991_9EURO|nr:hypothetical protein N7449_001225 [Penicillium cf. viridicatum]